MSLQNSYILLELEVTQNKATETQCNNFIETYLKNIGPVALFGEA